MMDTVKPFDPDSQKICDEAFTLMERALALLDTLHLQAAATLLDHAICLIPDAAGNIPRARLTLPPVI